MRSFDSALEAELAELVALGRRRACPELAGLSRTDVEVSGQPHLSFCSNDYLGLSEHSALRIAAGDAAMREGFGASASRLVSGDLPAHRRLEQALARFFGRPAALVFPSGYQTNIGVLTALAGPDDVIVSDALNHASIIDGCRLSRARIAVYPHRAVGLAAQHLDHARGARRRLLVTESLFSMNGDAAPLGPLADAAKRHDAVLIVDEAHAVGVLGPRGRGLCAAAGVEPEVLIGTLGKALSAAGGFVVSSRVLRDLLVNRARSFIFTTALPPPVAAAALAALEIVDGPEGDRRRALLRAHVDSLEPRLATLRRSRAGAGEMETPAETAPGSPIQPFIVGSDAAALALSAALANRRIFVPAIRPPTVPAGAARLRITLSASHTPANLDRLIDALGPLT